MSSDRPPEFFFDRNLGKRTADALREAGWIIHLITEHYPDDASEVPDPVWIAEGCSHGWVLLTKDQRIRYRADELAALKGQLFCLASGNLPLDQMASRFLLAGPAIRRALEEHPVGFWLIYDGGRIAHKWP